MTPFENDVANRNACRTGLADVAVDGPLQLQLPSPSPDNEGHALTAGASVGILDVLDGERSEGPFRR